VTSAPLDTSMFGEALAVSPLPACVIDLDADGSGRVLAASASLGHLLRRPPGELVGISLDELLTRPELPPPAGVRDLNRSHGTLWVVRRSDELPEVTVELHVGRIGPSSRNLRLIQIVDVSTREKTQRSLRGAVRRLQDVIDNSSALIFVKDLEGRYVLANRSMEDAFGLLVQDVLGRRDDELFPPGIAANYQTHDRYVLETARPLEAEEYGPGPGRTWLSIKFPLLDEFGKPYALGGISTDITERLQIEATARQARDEAQRASQAKSEFLSRLSHELRTPLNAILGFGQLLDLEALPAEVSQNVAGILSAGRHLLGLIDEILDLSRIEAGALDASIEAVDVSVAVNDALALVRPLALHRGIELVSDLHGGLYEHVLADRRGLKQALLNLLDNAIKYTPTGGGVVRVAFRDVGDGRLRIIVVDTGPGLTEAEQAQVFVPFKRLAATSGRTPGNGLGLSVSRSLVEAMGGALAIQHSSPGEGSAFYIDLLRTSRPSTEPSAISVPEVHSLGPARVLYIEDDPSNIEVVQQILAHADDVEVTTATDGRQGVQLALHGRPDVVLLDLSLPDVDGGDVLRRLTTDPATQDIPVIVLSADATPERQDDLIADGAYAYVTKPLDISTFLATLRRSLTGGD
jgi:PAS domain S-box-containing protein